MQNLLRSLTGGGIQAPASVTGAKASAIASAFQYRFGGGVVSRATANSGGFLSRILGGLTGGGAVSLLPALLGGGLGAGVGGQSLIGQALGLVGGSAVGLGLSFGASVFGAGGGLGAASLAALGPAALIGAPLLVGALLLGRARQRAADESTSGSYIQQAVDAIHALRESAQAGQLASEAEARGIFESQILRTFIEQINTIRTASVRESRLTNQTADLRRLFESSVIPHVKNAIARQVIDLKLLSEFHLGGISPQEQIAKLLKNEMVLTVEHQ